MAPAPDIASLTAASRTRRRALSALALAITFLAGLYGTYWFAVMRYYESTDDAYVDGDVVQITSEVPGTILAVRVDDTQSVTRGQPLVELDPAEARIEMAAAQADLARIVRQVRGLYAESKELRAQIEQRSSELRRAVDDTARRERLIADGAVSGEEVAHARETTAALRSGLVAAKQRLAATLAQTDGTELATHPQVLAAVARVRNAALNLRRSHIEAPVAGIVTERRAQVGQHVGAGAPLMAVVALDDVWVNANFKESQLERMSVGQPVTLHADLYGSDIEFHGIVAGFPAGSGSAFALLPPQNAAGNWIKIVQRLPVRIVIDARELEEHPLRLGLSMRVQVDTRGNAQQRVKVRLRNAPLPTRPGARDDPELDARIAQIIRDNSVERTDLPSGRPLAGAARAPLRAGVSEPMAATP